jgi:hypothetical protein
MADAVGPGELLIDVVPTKCGTRLIGAAAFSEVPVGAPVGVVATDAAIAARMELRHHRREPIAITRGCGYLTRTATGAAVARPEPGPQRGSRR